MIEQSKKLVNKWLKASAAVAVVGVGSLSTVAQAEETTETKPVETTKPAEETKPKEPQNLAEAQALVAVATTEEKAAADQVAKDQAAVATQEGVVAEANAANAAASQAEADAEKGLAEAQALAAEATPEKIAEVTEVLAEKTAEQATAETEVATAQATADAQATELTEAQSNVRTAQAEVDAAQAAVTTAQAGIKDPEALAQQKQAAENRLATLEQELQVARQQVTTVTAEAANAVTLEIAQKEAEVIRLTAEIARLQSEISIVNKPVDVTGGNTLTLPSTYPTAAIKELIVASQSRYTGGEANFNTVLTRAKAGIEAQAAQGMAINTYKAIQEDLTRTVDPANLSPDVQNELANFVAAMINPIRQQLGLSQAEVVTGAQDFAKRLANHMTAKGTLPASLHDFDAIRSIAGTVGLKTNDTFLYEALGMTSGNARTVNDLKAGIYYSLKMMIFEDHKWSNDLGHTLNLLRNDAPKVYIGVGTSTAYNQYGNYNQHILMVPSTNIVSSTKFSTAPVAAVRQLSQEANNTAKIAELRGQIAGLQTRITTLKGYQANPATNPTVAGAQQVVTNLTNQVTTTRATLANLTTELANVTSTNATNTALLTAARTRLNTAQGRLAAAQTILTAEQAESSAATQQLTAAKAKLTGLAAEVKRLTDLLAKYNQPNLVETAEQQLATAKANKAAAANALTEEAAKLTTLNQALAAARAILTEKQAALKAAQAILAKFLPTPSPISVTTTRGTRELTHAATGVRVSLQAGEDRIVAIRVTHKETNDANTPAILGGKDYDLFDIETVDAAGNFVQINRPARVTLPVDEGKRVVQVIYLPNANAQEELAFAETVMIGKDGRLVNAVTFEAKHFSDYAIVYAAGQTVAQATQQVLAHKPATAGATAKTLPNTGDKASLVATVLGSMLLSGVALQTAKRKED